MMHVLWCLLGMHNILWTNKLLAFYWEVLYYWLSADKWSR